MKTRDLRVFKIIFVLTIVFFISFDNTAEASQLNFLVDGQYVNFYRDNGKIFESMGEPYISNGRTMVPLRVISEELGHNVQWDSKSQSITIDDNIIAKIGDKNVKITSNNSTLKMDAVAVMKNGRTYVPIRFMGEVLNHKVEYKKYSEIEIINIIKNYKSIKSNLASDDKNEYIGRISNIDITDNKIYFQLVNYITDQAEMRKFTEDLEAGYYIEELKESKLFHLTDGTEYQIVDFDNYETGGLRTITKSDFSLNLNGLMGYKSDHYTLTTRGEEILKVEGRYTP